MRVTTYEFSVWFLIFMESTECLATSWAEWCYNDNPDFEQMLLVGGEL